MEFQVGVGKWNLYLSALELKLITRTSSLKTSRTSRTWRELYEDVGAKELGAWWKCV